MSAATDRRVLTGPRLSSAVSCTRRAVYEHLEAPRSEPTEYQIEVWERGTVMSDALRDKIVADLHREGRRPRREEEIPWPAADPIGIGHADLYVPSERLVAEVTTTQGCDLAERKVLQAAAYAVNHPRCESAVVIVVDPLTGDKRSYPLDLDALAPRVAEVERQVVDGIRTGELPERACRYAGDGPGMFCPFVEHCFADWQRPDVDELFGLDDAGKRLADLEDAIAAAKTRTADLEVERSQVRDQLRAACPAGEAVVSGGVQVKRIEIPAGESFSLRDLRTAGFDVPAELQAFVKPKAGSERWYVKRVGEA